MGFGEDAGQFLMASSSIFRDGYPSWLRALKLLLMFPALRLICKSSNMFFVERVTRRRQIESSNSKKLAFQFRCRRLPCVVCDLAASCGAGLALLCGLDLGMMWAGV